MPTMMDTGQEWESANAFIEQNDLAWSHDLWSKQFSVAYRIPRGRQRRWGYGETLTLAIENFKQKNEGWVNP